MRGMFTWVLVSTAALTALGCGGDNADSSNNGGAAGSTSAGGSNSGGASGGNLATQCIGSNAEFNLGQYLDQASPAGACAERSDATSVCKNNMTTLAGNCGKGCLGMGDDAAQAACVAGCIQDGLATGTALSGSCVDCYASDVACARKKCLFDCGLQPTSAACATCRAQNDCTSSFYACSGLAEPSSP